MFIIERLIGLAIYLILLLIFVFAISATKRIYMKSLFTVYLIGLILMAYFFVPNPGSDLYRIIPIINATGNQPIGAFIESLFNVRDPITFILYYVFGSLGLPNLLPAFTVGITYSIIFYIVRDTAKNFKLKSLDLAILMLMVMSSSLFFETISGIRTMLSFSIVGFLIYKEEFKDKNILINIPVYIIAALIHPAALFLIVYRFAFLIFYNMFIAKKRKFLSSITLLLISSILGFIFFDKIKDTVELGLNYFYNRGYSYIWEYIVRWIFIILFIRIIRIKTNSAHDSNIIVSNYKKYYLFSLGLLIVVVLIFIEYNMFHRLGMFLTYFSTPIFAYKICSVNMRNRKRILVLIATFSIIMLLISLTRGNLSSLKFFEI